MIRKIIKAEPDWFIAELVWDLSKKDYENGQLAFEPILAWVVSVDEETDNPDGDDVVTMSPVTPMSARVIDGNVWIRDPKGLYHLPEIYYDLTEEQAIQAMAEMERHRELRRKERGIG